MYNLKEHGVEKLSNVLSPEIVEPIYELLNSQIDDILKELKSKMAHFATGDLIADIDYLFKNAQELEASKELLGLAAGLYPLKTRLSKTLLKITESDFLINKIKKSCNTDHLKMHMPPAVRFVLPKNTHGMVPPHCDLSYRSTVKNFIVVWMPLTPITSGANGSGGINFFKKRIYKMDDMKYLENKDPYWLPAVDVAGLEPFSFDLNPGDVLMFDHSIVHQSLPNLSDSCRLSIDYRFFPGEVKADKHTYDLQKKEIIEPEVELTGA